MPDDHQVSNVLSEFARTMLTEFPIQAILDQLVVRIVEVLPITGAGVTLISPEHVPRYVAASSDAALRFEQLQTELREGPCLSVYRSGVALAVPDLRSESRFPSFGGRALAEGLVAVFTFPLRSGEARLGALDLYRDSPGELSPAMMAVAQTLADVAAAYLLNAQARADLLESADRSRNLALHDALTGLPNRILLLERLEQALARGRRSAQMTVVLFVDLDRFKAVNDLHGHRIGDELLVAVASRMTSELRPGDTLARLSGDEFVIVCEDVAARAVAADIGARVCAVLAEPFALSSASIEVTASIGIAIATRTDQLPDELLHSADLAMYQAKRRGGARSQIIDVGEQRRSDRSDSLQRDLQHARANGELYVLYQPIVTTSDGRLIGVEALLRWAHPSRGLISPSALVPLAEQTGAINEIGRWVLEQACAELSRWSADHPSVTIAMSVNVSAFQLMSPTFAAIVDDVLTISGLDPARLTLEITEGVFVRDSHRARVVLEDLKELGVMLALDDFGTGYSSLGYLKQFPVDVLKIDQSFVAGLGRDHASRAIVTAVVNLAHALGLTVVAEGVETASQHDEVAGLGCDASQGYYFSQPMAPQDVGELLDSGGASGVLLPISRFPLPGP